ncbi:MAG: ORF6N domain-containing protein, partial [Spirochaetales bacterium]|nr:ORF6N domain-containing protein [Spirochaetales bacterium]
MRVSSMLTEFTSFTDCTSFTSSTNNNELELLIKADDIRNKIYTIRGVQVMLDSDLAQLYQVETRILNQAVKRNINRFPERYCFQLTEEEVDTSKSHIVILNRTKGRGSNIKYLPHAFSEEGVAMLSAILRSPIAVQMSIKIMDAFVSMRHYLADNAMVFQRLDRIELKQLEADEKFHQLFGRLEEPRTDKAVIFFKGQMWDAASCIEQILEKAEREIILIDSYVDRRTLDMLSRKKAGVTVLLFTSASGNRITEKELNDFNSQYPSLEVRMTDEFHDRFLILD